MKLIHDRVISGFENRDISDGAGKERYMRVTERLVKSPDEEGVTLEYIRLTKDFEEIKEYVQHKGETLTGYKQTKEKVSVRIEDILYFETVDGRVFAYTVECVYEIKGRLYQVEEKVNKRNICRASKMMLVNVEHIISVRTALNGRLYARMENGEEILKPYFSQIECKRYIDAIELDRPEPLIEYILSCHGNQNQYILDRYKDFRSFVSRKTRGGFYITKDAGIFFCEK